MISPHFADGRRGRRFFTSAVSRGGQAMTAITTKDGTQINADLLAFFKG
jgi:hypothetical protein